MPRCIVSADKRNLLITEGAVPRSTSSPRAIYARRALGRGHVCFAAERCTGGLARMVAVVAAVQLRNIRAPAKGAILCGSSGALEARTTIQGAEPPESDIHDHAIMHANEVSKVGATVLKSSAAQSGAGAIGMPIKGCVRATCRFHPSAFGLRSPAERIATMTLSRRAALAPFATLPFLRLPAAAQGQRLQLTPSCGAGATPAQTEGPYFRPNTPGRQDLAGDAPRGEPILLGGQVLDADCRPVRGALLEIWHADEEGRYDNRGWRLRGHSFADEQGRWRFSTIVPARYAFRTRHYHFKVQRPGGPVLTTQLYFPDEGQNRLDRLFDERLTLRLGRQEEGKTGRFDFVV